MKKLLVGMLVLVMSLFVFTGCGGEEEAEAPAMPADLAAEVQVLQDHTEKFTMENLDGQWADDYVAYMATVGDDVDSMELMQDPDFRALADVAQRGVDANSSMYAYIIEPDGETVDEEGRPHFFMMMDTYVPIEDADPYLTDYGWEWQFTEAWDNDVASSAPSGWNEEDVVNWSTFAPIHDSEGNIVALFGLDTPLEIAKEYPEWNRDADEWNGIIEGPVAVAE